MTLEIFLFLIPVLFWITLCKIVLHLSFSWGEVALQAVATSVVIMVLFLAGNAAKTSDVKFVNGVVETLEPRKESCPIGWVKYQDSHCTEYSTRQVKVGETCTTNKDGKRSCTPQYDTEYNYYYSWERRYYVHADIDSFEIARVDRQGQNTPERFAAIEIGEPVAIQVGFTNYIKGASDSLFNEEPKGDDVVLAYPKIKDYYRASRVIISGQEFDSEVWKEWNEDLMWLNSNIRATGANAIIIVTGGEKSFSDMLARAWEAHNINDVVTVIGMNGDQIGWVDVASWSANSLVEVEIRDQILDQKTLDKAAINTIIESAIQDNFELQSMDKFEYLAEEIKPDPWVYILAGLILIFVTPAITYVFHKYEIIK